MATLRSGIAALDLRFLAVLALVAVTAIWGSTFVIIKDAITSIDPSDFLAVRFLIATVVLAVLFGRRLVRTSVRSALAAGGIGVVYGLAQLLQTWGLASTSASIAGFLTGAYVVLTPFIAFLMIRARITGRSVLASVVALVGIAVLSVTGLSMGGGEALTLLSALVYALHIVLVGRFAHSMTTIDLTAYQMLGISLITGVAALPEGIRIPSDADVWGAILYTALLASIGVLLLQSWAQRYVAAAATAVVMALEPIFATVFAIGLGGEALTGRLLLGGALVLTAILLSTVGGEDRADETQEDARLDDDPLDSTDPLYSSPAHR